VRVELYAETTDTHAPLRQEMTFVRRLDGEAGYSMFTATVPGGLPPEAYTARVIPRFEGVTIPMEIAHILWQH
jgi:starch phosphorylase